ncbi:MAG TPA: hypothetical protein PKW80_05815 [Bacteroidales bacterium]|nr:hypothetical protein [Bacteroidales bacterium]
MAKKRKTGKTKEDIANNAVSGDQQMLPGPPIIIYKTTKDYFKNVPVTLSGDKTLIVSYPDKKDVYYEGELAYPTLLYGGYLLDNRGIGPNSAFLKFTYEEYSRLNETPSTDVLIELVQDKDPFIEMYLLSCKRDTSDINSLIKSGLKKNCKKIK